MKRSRPLGLSLLLGLTFLAAPIRADKYAPQVGQRHPEIMLPSIADGKPVALSQFQGKKVLLIQFASW